MGEPNVRKERYTNERRMRFEFISNFLPNASQTPKNLSSQKSNKDFIKFITFQFFRT